MRRISTSCTDSLDQRGCFFSRTYIPGLAKSMHRRCNIQCAHLTPIPYPQNPTSLQPLPLTTTINPVRNSGTHAPALMLPGVSILLTMMIMKRKREMGLAGTDVLCYAFAPPPVFAPLEKLPAETRRAIRAFVFGNDMVSRLSLSSAYGVFRDLKEVDAVEVRERPCARGSGGGEANPAFVFLFVFLCSCVGTFSSWTS